MSRAWKSLRTNMMYWRFRYVTRNRLRLQSWWYRRRHSQPQAPSSYRPRASATYVAYGTRRRTWIALIVMVLLLAILRTYGNTYISPSLVWPLETLVVVLAIYWALRGA